MAIELGWGARAGTGCQMPALIRACAPGPVRHGTVRASLPTVRFHDSPQKRGAAGRPQLTEACAWVAGDQWGVGAPRFWTNLGSARRSRPAQSLASLAASAPPLLGPPLGPLINDSPARYRSLPSTADQTLAPVWLLIAGVMFCFVLFFLPNPQMSSVLILGNVLAGPCFSRIVLGGMGAYVTVAGSIIWFSSKVEEPY